MAGQLGSGKQAGSARLGSAMAGRLAWLDLADWIGSAPWAPRQAAAHFFFLFSFLLLFTSFLLTKRARRPALLLLLSLDCGSRSTARSSSGEWLGPGWVRLLRRGEARHGGRSRGARGRAFARPRRNGGDEGHGQVERGAGHVHVCKKPWHSSPVWSRESKEGTGLRARRRLGSQGHGGGSRLARASPGTAGP